MIQDSHEIIRYERITIVENCFRHGDSKRKFLSVVVRKMKCEREIAVVSERNVKVILKNNDVIE